MAKNVTLTTSNEPMQHSMHARTGFILSFNIVLSWPVARPDPFVKADKIIFLFVQAESPNEHYINVKHLFLFLNTSLFLHVRSSWVKLGQPTSK